MSTNKKYILSTLVLIVNVITGVLFYISFAHFESEESTRTVEETSVPTQDSEPEPMASNDANPCALYDGSYKRDQNINIISSESTSQIIGDLHTVGEATSIVSYSEGLYILDRTGLHDGPHHRLLQINLNDAGSGISIWNVTKSTGSIIASHNGALYILYDRYDEGGQLSQINLNDPKNCQTVIGDLPDDLSRPVAIVSHNGALYIVSHTNDYEVGKSDYKSELWQIDLNNLENTSLVGSFPPGLSSTSSYQSSVTGITSYNGDLYVSDTNINLWRINIRDPENDSRLVGRLPTFVNSMNFHNDILYAASGSNLWQVSLYDVENSSDVIEALPKVRDSIIPGGLGIDKPTAMASLGGALYIVDDESRNLLQVDLGDPRNSFSSIYLPVHDVDRYGGYGEYYDMSVNIGSMASYNGYLYITDDYASYLYKINLDDPDQRNYLRHALISGTAMTSHDGNLYIAGGFRKKQIWKLDPYNSEDNRTLIGDLPDYLSNPTAMASHNGILYIADTSAYGGLLWQVNLGDPESSISLGYLSLDKPTAMTSHEGVLYVAGNDGEETQLWKINLDD